MREALKRLNVNLDPETHQRFKLAAIAAGTDMTEAIKALIDDYIRKHLPPSLWPKKGKKKP